MSTLKHTETTKIYNIEVSNTPIEVNLTYPSLSTIIRVKTGGGIRAQINGDPSANFENRNKGVYIDKDSPLLLQNHVLRSLKLISDIDTTIGIKIDVDIIVLARLEK